MGIVVILACAGRGYLRSFAGRSSRDSPKGTEKAFGVIRLYGTSAAGFLPFAAVGCRTHPTPAPRSGDGERPAAIRVNHEVERSARVVVDHALILSTVLRNA